MFQKKTEQMNKWMGSFGNDYTYRNAHILDALETSYKTNYGITRTELNELFVGDMDRGKGHKSFRSWLKYRNSVDAAPKNGF